MHGEGYRFDEKKKKQAKHRLEFDLGRRTYYGICGIATNQHRKSMARRQSETNTAQGSNRI